MQRAIEILQSAIKWMDNPKEIEAILEAIAALERETPTFEYRVQGEHDHGC
jgi:hypothetical protein